MIFILVLAVLHSDCYTVGPVAAPRRADVYAAALGQFAIPAQFAEQQLADPRPAPRPVAAAAGPVTYRIVTASTNKDRV